MRSKTIPLLPPPHEEEIHFSPGMINFRTTLIILAILLPVAGFAQPLEEKVLEGIVMVAKVKGKAYLEFNGQVFRAKKRTKAIQGVVVNVPANSNVVLLLANGAAISLKGPSKVKIERFLIASTILPPLPWAKTKKEPSSSDFVLRLDYGDVIFETKALHEKSNFAVRTPFGEVRTLPNEYDFKTLFRIRYSEDYPMVATWEGLVELESPEHEPRIISRDEQLFVHPEKGLLLAHGLTAKNVQKFEQTMTEFQTALARLRIK